jgi:hypothetical protein
MPQWGMLVICTCKLGTVQHLVVTLDQEAGVAANHLSHSPGVQWEHSVQGPPRTHSNHQLVSRSQGEFCWCPSALSRTPFLFPEAVFQKSHFHSSPCLRQCSGVWGWDQVQVSEETHPLCM